MNKKIIAVLIMVALLIVCTPTVTSAASVSAKQAKIAAKQAKVAAKVLAKQAKIKAKAQKKVLKLRAKGIQKIVKYINGLNNLKAKINRSNPNSEAIWQINFSINKLNELKAGINSTTDSAVINNNVAQSTSIGCGIFNDGSRTYSICN